jgi:hypothetical protein
MSQPFIEIALLQIVLILASLVFCLVISRQVRKVVVPLTQFRLRTLLIVTGALGLLLALGKANPELVAAIFDDRYYFGFDDILNAFLFTALLFGGPLLGHALIDNFRYERDLRRERRERWKQLSGNSAFTSQTRRLEPAQPQWID